MAERNERLGLGKSGQMKVFTEFRDELRDLAVMAGVSRDVVRALRRPGPS